MESRVYGKGFTILSLGFKVESLGFRVRVLGRWVSGFRFQGVVYRLQG